jgi:hypothetical protein
VHLGSSLYHTQGYALALHHFVWLDQEPWRATPVKELMLEQLGEGTIHTHIIILKLNRHIFKTIAMKIVT